MPTIQVRQGRLPLVVFVLLVILLLMLIGFACACASGSPMQIGERSASGIAALPALVELWKALVLVIAPAVMFAARPPAAMGRASPADLQRFVL